MLLWRVGWGQYDLKVSLRLVTQQSKCRAERRMSVLTGRVVVTITGRFYIQIDRR